MSVGIGIMIAGGLVVVLGLLLLLNHSGFLKIFGGIALAALGVGAIAVGHTMDGKVEITYTVTEITAVSSRDTDNTYRVGLTAENGSETWIYVREDMLYKFPKDGSVTLTKDDVARYKEQNTKVS